MKKIDLIENVWLIKNFLTEAECENLITFSEYKGYTEAEVSIEGASKMMKNIRNNDRLIYTDEIWAAKYWEKLKEYCPKNIENWEAIGLNEKFRFYKYSVNQRFKRHIDGRFKRNENEESRITFLIYLNDDFEGGSTIFKDLEVKPKTGDALCFFHEIWHEGSIITEGVKYVLRSDIMYRNNS